MSDIYEEFKKEHRKSALKWLKEKEANEKVDPNKSKTVKAAYVIKHGDVCDYFK